MFTIDNAENVRIDWTPNIRQMSRRSFDSRFPSSIAFPATTNDRRAPPMHAPSIYSPFWRRHLRQTRSLSNVIDEWSTIQVESPDQVFVTLHNAENFEIHREHPWHFRFLPCRSRQLHGKRQCKQQAGEKDESDHSTLLEIEDPIETVRARCR